MSELVKLAERDLRLIPGFSRYAISNDGIVHRIVKSRYHPNVPDIVKQWPGRYGRLEVFLTDDAGKSRHKTVNYLVALAWIGPPPEGKPHSAHLDGVPSHNHFLNLVWASQKENESHKKLHGTFAVGEQTNSAKLTPQQVREIKSSISRGVASRQDMANKFGVNFTTICRIADGKQWQHIKI